MLPDRRWQEAMRATAVALQHVVQGGAGDSGSSERSDLAAIIASSLAHMVAQNNPAVGSRHAQQ